MSTLCLDPGVRSTGWAYWSALSPKHMTPDEHGVWRAPARATWQASCRIVTNEAVDWYAERYRTKTEPDRIVCEWPQLWGSSAKSYAAAERDSLAKMHFLLGRLQEAFESQGYADDMVFVTPDRWKAQLPKSVVIERLKKWTGVTFSDHEADAVGIGMFLLGRLP